MYNFAILGAGFIGKNHAQAINNIPNARLVAVVDINEEVGRQFADEFGCAYYNTPDEALQNEQIDIVDVCLPTFLHEEYVLWAAKNKLHVLCEKPFALSAESGRRMIDACRSAGVKLMVAQVVRWFSEYVYIHKRLDEGAVGNIIMVNAKRLAQHPNWSTWHRDPTKSGGGLYDLHIHDVDYLRSVFGPVDSVYAIGWKSPTGCWNHVISNFTFKNGVKASCEAGFEMPNEYPFTAGMRIVGDEGGLDYSFVAGFNIKDEASSSLVYYKKDQNRQEIRVDQYDPYQAEIEAFIDCIANNTDSPVDNEESYDVLRIVEAIKTSLESGQVVYL